MGGPMVVPSGRLPSRIALMISPSLHLPMPVSGSGVMFGAWATPKPSSNLVPPASSLPGTGPCGVCGVWQLPQATMLFIRYFPRSSGVCADAAAMPANTPTETIIASRITPPPSRIRMNSRSPLACAYGCAKQKGRHPAPFSTKPMQPSRRSRRFLRLLILRRAGILTPGVNVAVDELDHRDRCRVAVTEPGLEHARIAAVALLVARADDVEELLDHGDVADFGDGLAPRVQIAALAQGDQLLHDRAEILGLGQRRHDLLVLDERSRHVAEHGAAMLRRAVELAVGVAVAHRVLRFPCPSSRPSALAREPESMTPARADSRR